MATITDIKKYLKSNANKKAPFCKWYVDTKDKTKENYNKAIKNTCQVEFETAMGEWLMEEDVQEAIKQYLKNKRSIKMLEIYDSMLQKALGGDVKSAEWVDKFFKSDYFEDDEDEINDFLEGINIPCFKKGDK